jgi:hypothetical protein
MSSWLKAGLVGAVVLTILNLLGLIPYVGCFTCILGFVAYAGIGALAAHWMPPLRLPGPAAGQGAMAAMIAALIGGVVNTIILVAEVAIVGSTEILSQLPPETLQQLEQQGLDPQVLNAFAGPGGAVLGGSMCCLGGVVLAALLGAIGGAIYAGIRAD